MNRELCHRPKPEYKLFVDDKHITTFRPFNFQVVQVIDGVRYNFLKVDHKTHTIRAEILN